MAALMAGALAFDMKRPRKGGVAVAAVLARRVRIRFPNTGD